ncbi:MAG: patatin-like phospholipase family protein [Algibacter sp.]|uniref:patatin-like phospholipase family protein n=1 Tax=Algibacter sp. TaxID=1872428 RepID=UPI00260AEAD5|nr:patatin-like phospholipase family protein [Algibacter sp.]MDG1730353.1 patatin-like phospholipase family protein [Algibacter sp.]MDG2178831.1 patatin-like phospholipase family protein [Algibacter sp.]
MNIGLVLSGGGMRGAAHIGAIKALEEHNIYPTHIAGTSAGAIVGALYAYGNKWEDIFKFFKGIQILDITKYALNKPGFIDAEKFYSDFKNYMKDDDFSFLKKKLNITATNILNGNLEVFDKGELIKPILASAAIPGIFTPVKIKDSYYVDGGALNNFPVELLKPTCDKIIGVYVNGFDTIKINDLKHSYHVLERAFKLKSVKDDQKKFIDCDLVISPEEINNYGIFDKKYLEDIFKIGYDATKKALVNDRFLIKNFKN